MAYSSVNVEDIEPAGPRGAVRFVRRELGVEAFGINWFELPANAEGREHDETNSGQEEVSIVVRGSGHWRADGEEIPVRVGSFVRFDPGTVRCPVAGPDGMTFVSVGAPPGAYQARGPF
jgi:quercetin dioxygenase-like cupin family protein